MADNEVSQNEEVAPSEVDGPNSVEAEVSSKDTAVQPDVAQVAEDTIGSGSGFAENAPKPVGNNVVSLGMVQNIRVTVQAMLGGITLSVKELSNLKQGQLISLGTTIGEPVRVLANGEQIALGEIVVIEEEPAKFGVVLVSVGDGSSDDKKLKA